MAQVSCLAVQARSCAHRGLELFENHLPGGNAAEPPGTGTDASIEDTAATLKDSGQAGASLGPGYRNALTPERAFKSCCCREWGLGGCSPEAECESSTCAHILGVVTSLPVSQLVPSVSPRGGVHVRDAVSPRPRKCKAKSVPPVDVFSQSFSFTSSLFVKLNLVLGSALRSVRKIGANGMVSDVFKHGDSRALVAVHLVDGERSRRALANSSTAPSGKLPPVP
mmetsp:Transcript_30178/g.54864  ORF Transcript_30178/g.54864 Transcript_30178/m.54864 type:complete len:224 (+) Transcript_30178:24-695(+)